MEELERSDIGPGGGAGPGAGMGTDRTGMSRRTFLKTGLKFGAGILGLMAMGSGYSLGIEPRWLETVRNRLELPKLPEAFKGTKLVQFSDTHIGFHFGLDRLEALVDRIMDEKPDMICFTGDLVEESLEGRGEDIARILSRLSAPLGKFAVLGNHDYLKEPKQVVAALKKAGFTAMQDHTALVEKGGAKLRVTGLEGWRTFSKSMDKVLSKTGEDECCIVLAHMPDLAISIQSYHADLQLAGHSHGGQIRLPFYGPITRVPGAKLYPDGLVRLQRPQGGEFKLYTSRGIGMTNYPIRFLCRPELSVHTLV